MRTLVWTKTERVPFADFDTQTAALADGSVYEFKLFDANSAFFDGCTIRVIDRRRCGYLYKLLPVKRLVDAVSIRGTEDEIFESIEKRIAQANPEGYLATVLKN